MWNRNFALLRPRGRRAAGMGDDEEELIDTGFGLKPVTWGDGGKVVRTGQGNWRVVRARLGGEPGGEQTPHRADRERIREDRVGSDLLQ